MRLIPAGIAALVAGFAFGLALQSGDVPAFLRLHMSEGSRVRAASLVADVPFVSAVAQTERRSESPVRLPRRVSFDERFVFDQPPDSLDERFVFSQPPASLDERFVLSQPPTSLDLRFAVAAVSTVSVDERTSSVLRTAPLPSPDPEQQATAHPAVGRSAQRVASLTSPPLAGASKKIRLAAL